MGNAIEFSSSIQSKALSLILLMEKTQDKLTNLYKKNKKIKKNSQPQSQSHRVTRVTHV